MVVLPDRCREHKKALSYLGVDLSYGASVVGFQIQLGLESIIHRLDHLAQGFEDPGPGPECFVRPGRAQAPDPMCLPVLFSL